MMLMMFAIASVLCIPALAASDNGNYTDHYFTNFKVVASGYTAISSGEAQEKRLSKSMYLYISAATTDYTYARALGSTSKYGAYGNYTYYNGQFVDHVSCESWKQYNVHTYIYESLAKYSNPYPYAKFSFCSPYLSTSYITGAWSADCQGSYYDATP